MKRSVDEFRRTAKDVESRLDMLQWKMEALSQNGFKTDNPDLMSQQDPVTVSKLLKEFTKVKNDFSGVKQELKQELEKMSNESTQLQERLESMKERFDQLKENVGEPPE